MSSSSTLKIGQTVKATTGKDTHQGILRYIGPVDGGPPGEYCGIELPKPTGKNNGTVKGKEYFRCAPGHGLFVKKNIVTAVSTPPTATATKRQSASTTPVLGAAARASSAAAKRQSVSTVSSASVAAKRQSVAPTTTTSAAAKRQSISAARSTPASKPPSRPASRPLSHLRAASEASEEDHDPPEHQEPQPPQEPEEPQDLPGRRERPRSTRFAGDSKTTRISENESRAEVVANTVIKAQLAQLESDHRALQGENERLHSIVGALQGKLKAASDERKQAQVQAQEADAQKSAQLESELELATLDKEMAEERADSLEYELNSLKAKFEELELEADILREENKELGINMTEEEKADAGWIHLERERDRLREALLLLRDHKQELEAELREEIDHLQSNLTETEEAATKYLEITDQLHRVEDTNTHLREQLEAAENQEEVISNMMHERDKHLEQIETLRASLVDLEDLAQTNEDLEGLYLDNERTLLHRLDEQEAQLHERERKTTEQDRVIEDLEYTLNKFRTVVQGLQSDIDDARRTREISELQAHEMNSRSKAMMELNVRLQNNAAKSQTKAIEIEMVRAHAMLQERQINILSLFLPESFDSERTPITALLTFSKLKTKAGLVANMLSERLRERGHLSSGEETLSAYEVIGYVQWIHHTAGRFERFMSSCSPEEFAAFSNANQELEPVERAVTNWLEALKNDELGVDSPEHMQRMQSVLTDLSEKLMPSAPEINATLLIDQTQMTAAFAETTAAMFDWLSKVAKSKLGDPTDDDSDSIDFDRKLDQLSTRSRTLKLACAKVVNELEKRRAKNICLNETSWSLFADTEQQAGDLNERVRQLCHVLLQHLTALESEEEVSYATLVESFSNGDDNLFSTLLSELKDLHARVDTLSIKAFDQSTQLSFEPQPAPWTIRAKDLKAQRLISAETQEELAQSSRRNQELASRISEKERQIEEITIRAELAEKRVKDNKSRDGQDKALKEEVEHLKSAKSELETHLSTLQTELLSLQEEHAKAKADISLLEQAASEQLANGSEATPASAILDPAANALMSTHVKGLLAQIEDLQATTRHLRSEVKELSVPISAHRSKAMYETWLGANLLKPPKSQSASKLLSARQEQNIALDHLLAMSKSVNMKVVNLKDTMKQGNEWRSMKNTTKWQVAKQKEDLAMWETLRDETVKSIAIKLR